MTATVREADSPEVGKLFLETQRLAVTERLTLAKLLLESVLADQQDADAEWSAMGLTAFQRDWDNEEDAVYDNWREHYGVPSR
jgi:hypothetical protein